MVSEYYILVDPHFQGEEEEDELEIPLPLVKEDVLKKVIEFLKRYEVDPMKEIEKPLKSDSMVDVVGTWYANYVDVDQTSLFDLIQAANYMDIKSLLDLTCVKV